MEKMDVLIRESRFSCSRNPSRESKILTYSVKQCQAHKNNIHILKKEWIFVYIYLYMCANISYYVN